MIVRLVNKARGEGLKAKLLRGGAGSIIVKVSHIFMALGVTVLLANVLGPAGYGVYAYVFALVSLMAIPAQFGLPNLVVRETAKAQANEQWGLMRGLWRWTNGAVGVLALLIALLAGGLAWALADLFTHLQLTTFVFSLLLVPLIALGNLRGAALRGLQKVVQGQLPECVLRPGLLIALVGGMVLLLPDDAVTAAHAMGLHALAAGVAFVIGAMMLARARPAPIKARPAPTYEGRAWVSAAVPLGIIGGMQVISAHTDVLMLGLFVSAEDVGIYRIAVQAASLVAFPISAMNMVIAPFVSHLFACSDMSRLQRMVTSAAIFCFVSAGSIALVFVVFGGEILALVFGEAFRASYLPMAILCVGQIFVVTLGSLVTIANMSGHERETAKIMAIGAALNVVLNLLLIPPFGVVGAATATVASLAVWRLILFFGLIRWTGINPSIVGMRKLAMRW